MEKNNESVYPVILTGGRTGQATSRPQEQEETSDAQGESEHTLNGLSHQDVATIAHQFWESRGCPQGSPEDDWFLAVEECRRVRNGS